MNHDILNSIITNKEYNALFVDTIAKSISKTNYVHGGPAGLLLEEIICLNSGLPSVDRFWGPGWVLSITIIADRILPVICPETKHEAILYVTRKMTGHALLTPSVIFPPGVGLRLVEMRTDDCRADEQIKDYINTATKVCKDLGIPSPIETMNLYAVLGDKASPTKADELWKSNPDLYQLDPALISMYVNATMNLLGSNFETPTENGLTIEYMRVD